MQREEDHPQPEPQMQTRPSTFYSSSNVTEDLQSDVKEGRMYIEKVAIIFLISIVMVQYI